jgi:hypothetical protein
MSTPKGTVSAISGSRKRAEGATPLPSLGESEPGGDRISAIVSAHSPGSVDPGPNSSSGLPQQWRHGGLFLPWSNSMCCMQTTQLSRVVKAKAGPSPLTWTAWVKFLPSPTHDTCLLCSATSCLMKLACLLYADAHIVQPEIVNLVTVTPVFRTASRAKTQVQFFTISLMAIWPKPNTDTHALA